MNPITQIAGKAVPVPGADIDTDRIIPARFMKCVTFDDLAEGMFYDVRFDPKTGEKTDHPLNNPAHEGASILLSGPNFGCGSSREHAPQSIYRNGYRAIIAESYAEIFFGNATTLGMACVTMPAQDLQILMDFVSHAPETMVTINLASKKVHYADVSIPVEIPDSAHAALTTGRYDPLQELLQHGAEIRATAEQLGYV